MTHVNIHGQPLDVLNALKREVLHLHQDARVRQECIFKTRTSADYVDGWVVEITERFGKPRVIGTGPTEEAAWRDVLSRCDADALARRK